MRSGWVAQRNKGGAGGHRPATGDIRGAAHPGFVGLLKRLLATVRATVPDHSKVSWPEFGRCPPVIFSARARWRAVLLFRP